MYTVYTHDSTITKATLIADLQAILTGETVVSNLSTSGNGPGTVIDATSTTSSWTVLNNNPVTGDPAVTLQSQIVDDAASLKTIQIIARINKIETIVSDDLGNIAKNSDMWDFPWASEGQEGVIHISASDRHILFNSSSGNGSTGPRFGPYGVIEYTRRSPWDTVSNGFDPFAFFAPQSATLASVYPPLTLDAYFNTDQLNSESFIQSVFAGGGQDLIVNQRNTLDATRTTAHALIPFGHSNADLSNEGGDISSLCDIYLTSSDTGGSFDEVVVGADTYVIWVFYSNSQSGTPALQPQRWAIRKG